MAKYLHCTKCLTGRTGDKLGDSCRTMGCDGVITEVPEFKTLVDEQPEEFLCPRREEQVAGPFKYSSGPDHWQKFKTNGQRVCSYCGSLHPEDMFALVKKSANTPADADYRSTINVDISDKKYKVYVHQPDVRNASEGGIKFYMMHLPRKDGKIDVTDEQQQDYAEAVRKSNDRFNLYLRSRKVTA